MSAPKILTAICITCDKQFSFEYKGRGRKTATCSPACKATRSKKNKRAITKQAKVGDEYPINHKRPNISESETYKAMSAKALDEFTEQGEESWYRNRLRGSSPDVDASGWERRMSEARPDSPGESGDDWVSSGRVNDLNGFIMDDFFDSQKNPLHLIDPSKRETANHWLKKHWFKAGYDVGRTSSTHLPVLGSPTRVAQAITPEQYRRHFGQPSTRPTGALTPFVWHMDEPAPEVVEIHAWGIPMRVAA